MLNASAECIFGKEDKVCKICIPSVINVGSFFTSNYNNFIWKTGFILPQIQLKITVNKDIFGIK